VTVFHLYVGELGTDAALDWGGESGRGNIPQRIGPWFPAANRDAVRLSRIIIDELGGRRVDWGAEAARVGVEQLRRFATQFYGDAVPAQVAEFVATLDPERSYALVLMEH
jgi:hypothetical protein